MFLQKVKVPSFDDILLDASSAAVSNNIVLPPTPSSIVSTTTPSATNNNVDDNNKFNVAMNIVKQVPGKTKPLFIKVLLFSFTWLMLIFQSRLY